MGVGVGLQGGAQDGGGQVGQDPGDPGPPVTQRGQGQRGVFQGAAFLGLQRFAVFLIRGGGVQDVQDPPAEAADLWRGELVAVAEQGLLGLPHGAEADAVGEGVEGVGDRAGVADADLPGGERLPGHHMPVPDRDTEVGLPGQSSGPDPGLGGEPGRGGAGAGLGGDIVGAGQDPELERGEAFGLGGQGDQQLAFHRRGEPVGVEVGGVVQGGRDRLDASDQRMGGSVLSKGRTAMVEDAPVNTGALVLAPGRPNWSWSFKVA